jgi:hypothetical protein
MLLPDVNILAHAYREDAPEHDRFKDRSGANQAAW